MPTPRSWDVFCRVVDNFGDAAVCWRLARALAALPTAPQVRLWIDELEVLGALVPEIAADQAQQTCAGVRVCRLFEEPFFGETADVAVDGFGAGLPEVYAHAMVERRPRPLWIVLEYLSAESWVASHHGLPSPHPHLPLQRYFFFPGFGPGTGGLLKDADLDDRREAFLADPVKRAAFWGDAGFEPPPEGAIVVSLFGYANAPVGPLLDAWATGRNAVVAAVPPSPLSSAVATFMRTGTGDAVAGAGAYIGDAAGESDAMAGPFPRFALTGQSLRRGSLETRFLPFLAQDRYDELLWSADWNFVRGEDSFVRAQWAERPLVWHIYTQAEAAHLAKLEAFLDVYCSSLEPALAGPLRTLLRAWNGSLSPADLAPAWSALAGHRDLLHVHARAWAAVAASGGNLAMNLANFCAGYVE